METRKIDVTPELERLLAQIIALRGEFLNQDDAVQAKGTLDRLGQANRELTDYLEHAIAQAT